MSTKEKKTKEAQAGSGLATPVAVLRTQLVLLLLLAGSGPCDVSTRTCTYQWSTMHGQVVTRPETVPSCLAGGFGVVPALGQVRTLDHVSKDELVVEFTEEAQVAVAAGRWLDVLGDSITPQNLKAIVLSNLKQAELVYGSAIAYEPGSFDFKAHNITAGVVAPDGSPMRSPRRDAQGRALYCPYAFRGPDWATTRHASAIDLATAYDYTSADTEWFQVPRNGYSTVSDDAASGHWSEPYFDEGAGNISMVTYSVAFSTEANLSAIGSPQNVHTGRYFLGVATVDIPIDDITMWQQWQYPTGLVVVVIVSAMLTLIVVAALITVIVRHRALKVMRASSPVFNVIMLIGAAVTAIAALPFVILPTPTNSVCQLRVAVSTMGVVTILAPLFAKTYRIARLFDNPKFQKLQLRDNHLLKPTILVILLQLMLVLAWLFVGEDPPAQVVREATLPELDAANPFFKIATCSESNGGMAATGLLFLLLVVGGTWFAYRARKAPIEFNESAAILACIGFMAFYAAILVPMFFIIKERSFTGSAMLRALGLLLGDWLMLAFLFLPKMIALRRVLNGDVATSHRQLRSASRTSRRRPGRGASDRSNGVAMVSSASQNKDRGGKGRSVSASSATLSRALDHDGARVKSPVRSPVTRAPRSNPPASSPRTTASSRGAQPATTLDGRTSGAVEVRNVVVDVAVSSSAS